MVHESNIFWDCILYLVFFFIWLISHFYYITTLICHLLQREKISSLLIGFFEPYAGNGELYPTINYALCLFRNLQAAICSYYDFEQPNIKLPSMSFIRDVTIGEGESIPPNTQFTKTWRLQNSGKSFPGLEIGCNFIIDNQLQPIDRLSIIISSLHLCSNWVRTRGLEPNNKW